MNLIEMLGTSNITESHFLIIEDALIKYTTEVLGDKNYKLLQFSKLEYRYDGVLPKYERDLIMKICKNKIDKKVIIPNLKQTIHLLSIFNQKALETIYDKERERKDKNKRIHSYEKDILRFEVRLNSRHFSYMKNSDKWKIERDLENYFKDTIFKKYLKKYFKSFMFFQIIITMSILSILSENEHYLIRQRQNLSIFYNISTDMVLKN